MFRIGLLGYGGYKNGDFPEDYELWLRLLDNNVKMFKLDQVLLEWRIQTPDYLGMTNGTV